MHKVWFLVITFSLFLTGLAVTGAYAVGDYDKVKDIGQYGLVSPGKFSHPQSIDTDKSGNLYVTDLGNKRIQKFDADGNFILQWGQSGTGDGQFHYPSGMVVVNDFVYVADRDLHRIQKFNTKGEFILEWGTRGKDNGNFMMPNGLASGPDGSIYVADTGNQRIQKFTADGNFVTSFGKSGREAGTFLTPIGVVTDKSGNVYVTDQGNNKIEKYDSSGKLIKSFPFGASDYVFSPNGIAMDPEGGYFVINANNERILHLSDNSSLNLGVFDKVGPLPDAFNVPTDLVVGKDGYLYVVDSLSHRVQKYETQYVLPTIVPKTSTTSSSGSTVTSTTSTSGTSTTSTTSTTTQTSNYLDITKPTIIAPNDILVEATGPLTKITIGQAVASDESGIKSITNNAPVEFPPGVTTIIWTAVDNAGNMAIDSQMITVNDSIPPSVQRLPDIMQEATSPDKNKVKLQEPIATDLVGVLSVTNNAPEFFSIGETTVTWTAKDILGNVGTTTHKVIITDTTSPIIHVPQNIVVEATTINENYVDLGQISVEDNGKIETIANDTPPYFGIGDTTVTWYVTDESGNTAAASQKVSIVDTSAPVISLQPEIIFEATSLAENYVNLGSPNVTDVQNFKIANNAPEFFPIGKTVVTWEAEDSSGNYGTFDQTVMVIDTTAPLLEGQEVLVFEASSLANTKVELPPITISDVSSIDSVTNDSPESFVLGNTTVTWTVSDQYGNAGHLLQTVSIVDTIPPAISPSADVVFEAVDPIQNLVELNAPSVNDLVEVASVTSDAPEYFPIGETVVTWTAIDTSGNTATAPQLVQIIDTTNPVLSVPDSVTFEAQGPQGTSGDIGDATATDVMGIMSITNDAPQVFSIGKTIVNWTAIDKMGNAAFSNQTVLVLDTISPEIIAPADVTFEATDLLSQVNLGQPKTSDAVGVELVENDAPEAFTLGQTKVTWTAKDKAGNQSESIQTVTVVDTTAPSIASPENITVEAKSNDSNIIELGSPIVEDNLEIKSITSDAPDAFLLGQTIVTWTATDTSGNSATAKQIISIVDTTAPSIIPPKDISIEATSQTANIVDFGVASASDLVEVASVTNDAPDAFPIGLTTVTWTATDSSGNSVSVNQAVNVVDTTIPSIDAPEDIVFEATSYDGNVVTIGTAEAFDNVQISNVTNDAPKVFPLGETVVTWTATDSSGNTSSDTQIIKVVDTTAPSIKVPQDITFEATSKQNSIPIGNAESSDDVSDVRITNDAPSLFPVGITLVTWKAVDGSGNSVSSTQTITVVDTTIPKITVPDDVTIEAISAHENYVDLGNANATDLVEITSISNDAPEAFPYGVTKVTWTAKDTSGNIASSIQLVKVVDTTEPVVKTPSDVIIEATSLKENVVDLGTATVKDVLPISSLTNDAPRSFTLGETMVTWTAVDEAGNTGSATQLVRIIDTTSPEVQVPQNITFEATSFDKNSVDIGMATADDAVKVDSITNDAPEYFKLGKTIVTWTATDNSGNSVSVGQTVNVVDTTAPTISAPKDITFEATSLDNNEVVIGTPDVNDTVKVTGVTNDAPKVFSLGETVVTWTATDSSGNTSSDTQVVKVVDTTSPVLVVPQNITFEATSFDKNSVDIGMATADDAVKVDSITNDAPEYFKLGKTIVTWTATDNSGNSVSVGQTVNVVDTTAPTISHVASTTFEATSVHENIIDLIAPVATDLVSKTIITNDAPDLFSLGETIVTWTAIDEQGNTNTVPQKVIVKDTTAPNLVPPKDTVVDATGLQTVVNLGKFTVSDLTDTSPVVTSDAPESFQLGLTIVNWTATDDKGNLITMEQKVTVQACGRDQAEYHLIMGTPDDDDISGTSGADLIFALAGNDVIHAENGDDCVFSGDGDDIVIGGDGDDTISSGDGNDMIKGQSGNDVIDAGRGSDMVDGGDDVDSCIVDNKETDQLIKCE